MSTSEELWIVRRADGKYLASNSWDMSRWVTKREDADKGPKDAMESWNLSLLQKDCVLERY